MNETLYIPSGSYTLDKETEQPQIRLGIQGYPKTGKTWSALTFPNCIVADLDRGLGAHYGRSDIIVVPFYDGKFCDKLVPRDGIQNPPNRRDAILKWLGTEAIKITKQQTLVFDGGTSLQNAFHIQYNLNPVISRSSGKVDSFAEWGLKIEYFGQIVELLKGLSCNVVYLCHEIPDRATDGSLNGQVRPLLSGQFGDQLASHFTDWFRQWAVAKPNKEKEQAFLDKICFGDKELFKEFMQTEGEVIYMWQTLSDDMSKCGSSSLVGQPKFVLANFSTFAKYKRKIQL